MGQGPGMTTVLKEKKFHGLEMLPCHTDAKQKELELMFLKVLSTMFLVFDTVETGRIVLRYAGLSL